MFTTNSSLRWVAAALLLVTAAVHVPLVPEHLREAPYVGMMFVALVLGCAGMALVLILHTSWITWELTAALATLALVAFLVSRTIGLPGLGDDVGNWTEPLGFPAIIAEILTTLVAARALLRPRATSKEGIS
jgi:hypothetical protein